MDTIYNITYETEEKKPYVRELLKFRNETKILMTNIYLFHMENNLSRDDFYEFIVIRDKFKFLFTAREGQKNIDMVVCLDGKVRLSNFEFVMDDLLMVHEAQWLHMQAENLRDKILFHC